MKKVNMIVNVALAFTVGFSSTACAASSKIGRAHV